MAQRFVNLEEAAEKLGVTKDRLNQLREAGKVRAYRDGTSWKFRTEDVEKLVASGLPTLDPSLSDLGLGSSDLSLDMDIGEESTQKSPASSSGLDLDLAEGDEITGPASDLSLEDVDEPTVPAGPAEESSAEGSALDTDEDDLLNVSDSILLNEPELGGATNRPPSTIIGKAEADPEGDLDLTFADEGSTEMSDVRLTSAASDVLSSGEGESLELEPPSPSDNFQGLAEVDVDLEAESSRILSQDDAQKVQAKQQPPPPSSDLGLALSESDSAKEEAETGAKGESPSAADLAGLSALELAEEPDEQVLGEGSDITLSSESSGINIISPSDSGLALDEVPLSPGSSGSPLDLGSAVAVEEPTLEPLELSEEEDVGEEPFQLTPLSEQEDEEKDSSQIIELTEEESTGVVFQPEEEEDTGVLVEDFPAAGFAPGAAPVAAPAEEVTFSGPVFAVLSISLLLLLVCGMMMFDLIRNIWSWDHEVTTYSSSLMDVLNPF